MRKQHRSYEHRNKFDILSAMWVLACNDQVPIMTYKGLRHRLSLPNDHIVAELVEERGELFRKKVSTHRLDEWKEDMRASIGKRPSWVRVLGNEETQQKAIDDLTVDDVFRSQFRVGRDAAPSDLSIIDWGLQHIERLRKADMEAREETFKRWQLWSVIVLSVVNLLVTILAALLK